VIRKVRETGQTISGGDFPTKGIRCIIIHKEHIVDHSWAQLCEDISAFQNKFRADGLTLALPKTQKENIHATL
jgi:hypothetical protein